MKMIHCAILASLTSLLLPAQAAEEAAAGTLAPAFALADTKGVTNTLAAAKGKYVVLEWINHDCPFVKKHYDSGNMQKLQQTYKDKGVVWYSICSSSPGSQGHYPAAKWNEMTEKVKAVPTAVLLDPDGKVGRLYGAKTTPHMFVIDPEGKVIYRGAIDDKPSTKPEDVATAKNYVTMALDAALAGKPVEMAATQPYGCSVKY